MTLIIDSGYTWDTDALDYVQRVNAADVAAGRTGGLESGVEDAIDAFVKGCKADGVWYAIRASCILAGAKSLAGALIPLAGPAPTNFNFASGTFSGSNYTTGDYNRKTGLVGDGSTKYLSSNYKISQYTTGENLHLGLYGTENLNTGRPMGVFRSSVYTRHYLPVDGTTGSGWGNQTSNSLSSASGHCIATRVTGQQPVRYLDGSVNAILNSDSSTPSDWPVGIFVGIGSATGLASETQQTFAYSIARIALYHIGDGLTATQVVNLSARVTALINAFGAAIP